VIELRWGWHWKNLSWASASAPGIVVTYTVRWK
jgi:hypothetical protein